MFRKDFPFYVPKFFKVFNNLFIIIGGEINGVMPLDRFPQNG